MRLQDEEEGPSLWAKILDYFSQLSAGRSIDNHPAAAAKMMTLANEQGGTACGTAGSRVDRLGQTTYSTLSLFHQKSHQCKVVTP